MCTMDDIISVLCKYQHEQARNAIKLASGDLDNEDTMEIAEAYATCQAGAHTADWYSYYGRASVAIKRHIEDY